MVGRSGASVVRLERDGVVSYLKEQRATGDRDLACERRRLVWLASAHPHVAAPRVVAFDDGPEQRLLTTAVPGRSFLDLVGTAAAAEIAGRFGAALRVVHDLPVASCPFDETLDVKLAAAERRVEDHRVDMDDFEPSNAGRTPHDVLAELVATRPPEDDLVVTHGDWCFPNVLLDDAGRPGVIDLPALGVACRWYDLGIGCRTTWHNVGPDAVPAFLEGYGIEPDDARIRYYILLDELQ